MPHALVARADDVHRSQFIRDGLSGRTIYFPPEFLARYDQRPGQLIDTLTVALSRFVADEKGGAV